MPRHLSLPGNAMARAILPGAAVGDLVAGLAAAPSPVLGPPAGGLATRAFPRRYPEA
ncbi:MAG: hypothetical protein OXH60_07925 [Rhodospirillales bacterium]|nr:hypothetical protein [Rhodospirillales bacterium]